jgi:hypothetical protein
MDCTFFLRDSLPWLQWLHWCREHDVDTVLAILAIIFATIQFVDSRLQEHLMKEQRLRMLNQSNQMEGLAKSMSTRFVGNFPLNMSEIVDVVSKTDAKLDIMCDVAAYGHYSQPTLFANYRNHIQAKRSANIEVRLIVYADDIYERLLSERFAQEKFEAEKKSDRLNFFFKSNPQHNLPQTHADFLSTLRQEQLSILRSFINSGVKIKTVTDTRLRRLRRRLVQGCGHATRLKRPVLQAQRMFNELPTAPQARCPPEAARCGQTSPPRREKCASDS